MVNLISFRSISLIVCIVCYLEGGFDDLQFGSLKCCVWELALNLPCNSVQNMFECVKDYEGS